MHNELINAHQSAAVAVHTRAFMLVVSWLSFFVLPLLADFTSFVPDNKVQHPQNQTFSNPNLSRFGFDVTLFK
jgi:hypothetical protein